ncbi:MAG TPA: AMP-binding protein [Streptosporangiaceae bacterium]|nr:AMP-binding protein [Streptosporangiaceae bacterium]
MIRTGDIPRLNAAKYPGQFAVSREAAEARTWQELNGRVNQLARVLLEHGAAKGDKVMLLAKNRIECVEAFFACAKIGVVYSPINWRFVPAEIEYVLGDSGCAILLCDTEYAGTIRAMRAEGRTAGVRTVIGFGTDHGFEGDYDTLLSGQALDEPPAAEIAEDDVCWICYTGGTTGMSKGVMLTHRNNFIQCVHLGIADRARHEDTYLVTGALFHVVLNMALAYWFLGCHVVIMDFAPGLCLDLIERHRVTKTVPVATMLNLLMQEQREQPRDLSSLVLCGTGGAPINPEVVRRASAEWECDFVQYFGQTEAAHHFTYLSAEDYRRGLSQDATETEKRRLASGGRVQHCDLMRIVDDHDDDLPVGAIGEICAQGPNVMAGYWNKPELTEQTLRGGWLHTGDIGYLDEDGYVYVVDRKKDMIVSGGENVYSSEVEAALYRSRDVLECAVIGVPDERWGESVQAFVVKVRGVEGSDAEVRARIIATAREYLAAYKVPKALQFIEALPKSATGKIQKAVLRDEFWGDQERRVGASAGGLTQT